MPAASRSSAAARPRAGEVLEKRNLRALPRGGAKNAALREAGDRFAGVEFNKKHAILHIFQYGWDYTFNQAFFVTII